MSDTMTPQEVAEYAVWYARKVKGPAAKVARALLEEFPWLREPLEAAALSSPETTPAGVLDEAWAAAEKALPEGWRLSVSQHPDTFAAFASSGVVSREGAPVGLGPTPAAALNALAAALGRSGSGGGRG